MHDEHTDRIDLTEPIGVLRLCMRTINALRAVRIWTLGQLVGITAQKRLPGLGIDRRAVGEIEHALQAHGLLSGLGAEGGGNGRDDSQRAKRATLSGDPPESPLVGRGLARRPRARPPAFAQTQEGRTRKPPTGRAPEAPRRADDSARGLRGSDGHAVPSRETTGGTNLSRRQDEAPRRMAPEHSAASQDVHWQGTKNEVRLYRVDDRWAVRLEVTGKMLRGGGRSLPGGVGSAIGSHRGTQEHFVTPPVEWSYRGRANERRVRTSVRLIGISTAYFA